MTANGDGRGEQNGDRRHIKMSPPRNPIIPFPSTRSLRQAAGGHAFFSLVLGKFPFLPCRLSGVIFFSSFAPLNKSR